MKRITLVRKTALTAGMRLGIAGWLALGALGWPTQAGGQAINPGTPWPATDALGRATPPAAEVSAPRADRFVGIFYFLTHNGVYGKSPNWDGPYDIDKIMQTDPEALQKPDSPLWGPVGMYHYWGQPLYGYYHSVDPWVIRRHAQLLADAGVDTLIFDTTNRVTYPETYLKICEVFAQVRAEGGRTPQLCFMVNTRAGETAQELYETLYKPGQFKELWFQWQGRPLMICDPAQASPEVKEMFTLRRAHWPFELVNTPYAWHWESIYPQVYGYTDDPNTPEMVNVAVAQNLSEEPDGHVTNMSTLTARGRSFHDGANDKTPGAINWGHNAQEQWKRALELDPPFVMVTGWNEWTAGRWGEMTGPITFVDQFDQQFSRDIEPMTGGHGDNYYYQLVSNVRRYKGAPPLPAPSAPQTIAIGGGFEPWAAVAPDFQDAVNETLARDSDAMTGLHYTNTTGRNDLVSMKVARDAQTVYFYARTREPLAPRADPAWMMLLIDADRNPQTGWEGYDYAVNRTAEPDGTTWLEKNTGGWNWTKVQALEARTEGNQLHLAIPRAALGLQGESPALALDFKWADHLQTPGDIMDFYLSGDVAPEGRFMYRYQTQD